MEVLKPQCALICWKIIKCLFSPITRLRKLTRKASMRQIRILISVVTLISCFITLILYYLYHFSAILHHTLNQNEKKPTCSDNYNTDVPMRHLPLNEIYKNSFKSNNRGSFELEDRKQVSVQMIDTPGCQIPLNMISYGKHNENGKKATCGRRAVFLKKINETTIQAVIKDQIITKYLRKSEQYQCCYRFLDRSFTPGHENKKIRYTRCKNLEDGSTFDLETDFINVQCLEYDKRNLSHLIYSDVYGFCKKINVSTSNQTCKSKYNVLLLGMDSMSLPRIVQTMSRTVSYLKDNFWLGYRGYHKVGDNTFPNLMAALTGKNLSTIFEKCSGKMDQCNDLLIWSSFKAAGYVTAYGEDYLRLPDTFNNNFAFRRPPTHHYMRPLFLYGETEISNKSLVCAGKVSSGQQLLDFALDFVLTYREDPFFGVFWMNSFSHNINSRPQNADILVENFLNRLSYTGALANTFIIFFSDHGIRFGDYRVKVESYYDERMPFLFLWLPNAFRWKQLVKYKAAAINQFRLVTPYDLYKTLLEIKQISQCNETFSISDSCRKCQSMFSVISANRTCQDAAIHDKWCSCHKLYPLSIHDTEGVNSIHLVVSYIKQMIKSVKTKRCWGCMELTLKNVSRIHFYFDTDKVSIYYVVAFSMSPGNVIYEATVLRRGSKIELVGSVSVISPYRGLGKCTIQPRDRLFCVCQKMENCR